ncbi:MAG: hypothetical protein WD273_02290 [Trueperaceae bacterium]
MTQLTASAQSQGSPVWAQRIREYGTWLVIAAIAFVLGTYVFAPSRQRAQPTYLPASYMSLATGVVSLQSAEGPAALLPVRIADNSSARMTGFRGVGEDALANQFLLYAQTRQTTVRTSYNLENVRVPLELAAFDAEGNLMSVTTTSLGQDRVSVAEPHRWLLAAKSGTFTHYGIEPGMTLDVESVSKINL